MTGIYKLTNNINGKIYIGQAVNIAARWKEHLCRPFEETCEQYNSHLYCSIRAYGIENFSFTVLEQCSKEELNEKESFWVEYYNSFNPECGYNLTLGGDGASGCGIFLDMDSVNEIKTLLMETDMTQWDIANEFDVNQATVSYINSGELWYDSCLVYPLREKKPAKRYFCKDCGAEIYKGSLRCVKCARKERKKDVNKPTPEELKSLILQHGGSFDQVGELYGITGKTIRRWCKGYGMPYYANDYIELQKQEQSSEAKRPVQQIDIITKDVISEFESIAEASRCTGVSHIHDVCIGKRKQAGGYVWRFI